MIRFRHAAPFLALLLVLAPGCGNDDNPSRPKTPVEGQVPDFTLTDVNPNSATHDQGVSPRDYLGEVSAWYFGHST